MRNYEEQAENIVKEFNRLVFEETNWKLEKEKRDVKVYSVMTNSSKKYKCYKGEVLVEMSPDKVNDVIHPSEKYRPQFDPVISHCELIEELSPKTGIFYQVIKPSIIGIRIPGDSIDLFICDRSRLGMYTVFSSIHYDQPFEKSQGIRGWAHPSGLIAFKTEDPNVSRAVCIYHAEFNLPSFLVTSMVEMTTVKTVVKYLEALKTMADVKVEPLGPETVLCRYR